MDYAKMTTDELLAECGRRWPKTFNLSLDQTDGEWLAAVEPSDAGRRDNVLHRYSDKADRAMRILLMAHDAEMKSARMEDASAQMATPPAGTSANEDTPDSTMNLGTLYDNRFRVKKPIPVEITRGGTLGVVATWVETNEFGDGENESEALKDLAASIKECFLDLRDTIRGADLDRVYRLMLEHFTFDDPKPAPKPPLTLRRVVEAVADGLRLAVVECKERDFSMSARIYGDMEQALRKALEETAE